MLEKAMAPHSSTLAWKIPWTVEPGGLQCMGSLRGHDWATSLSLFTFMHWRRKWQPTPVFLPGKSHGLWSLVGYCPCGRKESDTTEWLHFHFHFQFFTIEDNVYCWFLTYSLYYVEVCSFYSCFLEGFYHKWMLNFVKGFLCIFRTLPAILRSAG